MGGQSVQIRDDNAVVAVDGVSRALTNIDIVHARIHEGVLFSASTIDPAVGANPAALEVLIRVPVAVGAHMRFSLSVGADGQGQLFEGPTTTGDGTPFAAVNRNRFSSNVAAVEVFSGPTVTVPGLELTNILIPGGTFVISTGGGSSSFDEFVLAPGDYLARLTNLTAAATPIALHLDWYETGDGFTPP